MMWRVSYHTFLINKSQLGLFLFLFTLWRKKIDLINQNPTIFVPEKNL